MDTKISNMESSFSKLPSYQTNDMKEALRIQAEITNPKNEDVKRDVAPPTIADSITRTTLSYAKDKDVDTMVLKIKGEDGQVKLQIPEEVRLRIAKQMQNAYSPKVNSIIDDSV